MIVDIKKSLRLTFYFWFQEKKNLKLLVDTIIRKCILYYLNELYWCELNVLNIIPKRDIFPI